MSGGGSTKLVVVPRFCLFALGLLGALSPAALAQTSYELTDGGFVAVDAPAPGTPAAELAAARRLLAEGDAKAAERAVTDWLKAHPRHPRTADALVLRGDARVARGREYKALFDYEAVATFHPATEAFNVALRREFAIAERYVSGLRRRFLGQRWVPAGDDGAELLIRIQERLPGSELGERASATLADYYFEAGQMELATEAYDLLLENYPETDGRAFAMLRSVQASLARFKGPEFDATGLIDAQERLRQFELEFPAAAERVGAGGLRVRIRESLARRDLSSARWYDRTGQPVSAATLYRRLVQEYPDTAAGAAAARRLAALGEAVVAAAPAGGTP